MESSLEKWIDRLSRLYGAYAVTLSSYAILGLITKLNSTFYGQNDPIKFLSTPVYPEFYSLIFGIVFFAFILVVHLTLLNIKAVVTELSDPTEEFGKIRHGPWLASPFSKGSIGPSLLGLLFSLGILYTGYLGIAHLFGSIPSNCELPPLLYKWIIGGFDVLVFVVSAYLFYRWSAYVRTLRLTFGLKTRQITTA